MMPFMIPSPKTARIKRWAMAACLAVAFTFAAPSFSRADDTPPPDHDARVDGYAQNTVLDSGGTAFTYIVLCVVGGVCLGVLFISGKRTHLD
jgi:hypothetical protein